MYTAATQQGKNSFFTDPLFKNLSEENLRLQKTSPCIDKGLESTNPHGTKRICGKNIDIGAIEQCSRKITRIPGKPIKKINNP
jgi:hypothetical protein